MKLGVVVSPCVDLLAYGRYTLSLLGIHTDNGILCRYKAMNTPMPTNVALR